MVVIDWNETSEDIRNETVSLFRKKTTGSYQTLRSRMKHTVTLNRTNTAGRSVAGTIRNPDLLFFHELLHAVRKGVGWSNELRLRGIENEEYRDERDTGPRDVYKRGLHD